MRTYTYVEIRNYPHLPPSAMRCNGLDGHRGGLCTSPPDALIELGSGGGDGILPCCAAHIFYFNNMGRGIYELWALAVDDQWWYNPRVSRLLWFEDQPQPTISASEVSEALLHRLRAQYPTAVYPLPCVHHKGPRSFYSCSWRTRLAARRTDYTPGWYERRGAYKDRGLRWVEHFYSCRLFARIRRWWRRG